MTEYRETLPQLNGKNMTTTGGMETWLQYIDGFELPHFCLFDLLNDPKAESALRAYHRKVIEAVIPHDFGVIAEGLHYRASRDWGDLLGYSRESLAEINIRGIEFYSDLALEYVTMDTPIPVGGAIGPRGDAYATGQVMEADEAEDYHSEQIETLKKAGADMISAVTFSNVNEAIGVARAAKKIGIPLTISFHTKHGNQPNADYTYRQAIEAVDEATDASPLYYMINCSHPTEFEPALEPGDWTSRIQGFMPNAVSMNTAALCTLGHLEDGDPVELGGQMAELSQRYPHMTIWGGCCGTDSRHLGEIAKQVTAAKTA